MVIGGRQLVLLALGESHMASHYAPIHPSISLRSQIEWSAALCLQV